jgi:hypothetical protein
MELNEVNKIFGGNMLENESLEDTFKELMGLKESKPFECVGTIDEVRYALKEIVNRHYPNKSDNLPILLQIFIDEIDLDTIENVTIEQISSNNSHLIPDKFIKEIL